MRKTLSLVLVLVCLLSLAVPAAAKETNLQTLVDGSAKYMLSAVPKPDHADVGGEWAILGLARSGYAVPEGYYEGYYGRLESYVKKVGGVLHEVKLTEYSRVIVALSALGKDARDVGGYDLLAPLGNFEMTTWQGLNGAIWALIALDSASYPMPQIEDKENQATRQMYVDHILDAELDEGGWTLARRTSADHADPDITGMALQALSKYRDQPAVTAAIDRALDCMSGKQDEKGGFTNLWGDANSESVVQMLVALCELGIPLDDSRFVKNGNSLLDNLLTYRTRSGGFTHVLDGKSGDNQLSCEQGFYGLVAALRAEKGMNSLYRMSDAITIGDAIVEEERAPGTGLAGKHEDVTPKPVTKAGVTFEDVKDCPNQTAIEALAAREIINGMTEQEFQPDATMTRAQYSAIIVRALGLKNDSRSAERFNDVPADSWFAPFVGAASKYGIVEGRGDGVFDPQGTITRQEAAVMTVRAAMLCGLDTGLVEQEQNNILSDYMDYRQISSWGKEAMAWCYKYELMDNSALSAEPKRMILRGEVAEMLYRMLVLANLIEVGK